MPKRRARQIHLPRPRRSTMLGGEDRLTFVPERRIVRMCAYVVRVRAASPTHPSMLGIAYGSRCRVTLRISTKVSNATTAHNVDRTAVCALYVSIHIIPHYTHIHIIHIIRSIRIVRIVRTGRVENIDLAELHLFRRALAPAAALPLHLTHQRGTRILSTVVAPSRLLSCVVFIRCTFAFRGRYQLLH
jgi:hypothetical protein